MKRLLAIVLAASLAACSSLGVAPAKSFDQSLAYAEGQVTALQQSAAQAVAAHTLKPAAAQEVLKIADEATAAIAAARGAEVSGDTSTAQAKLAVATAALSQLAAFLAAQGVK